MRGPVVFGMKVGENEDDRSYGEEPLKTYGANITQNACQTVLFVVYPGGSTQHLLEPLA